MENKNFTNMTTAEICKMCGMDSIYISNITDRKKALQKVQAALMVCAKALSTTLGPNGSTTIIEERTGQHLITKDGLDVITRIRLSDPVANIVLEELRRIAQNQVHLVGDGSTSAIIIANALYYALTSDTTTDNFNGFSGKDIVDVLTYLGKYFEKELLKKAKPVSADLHEIEQMAAISTNNDRYVGANFREIYKNIGAYGFITQDTSKNINTDSIEYVNGLSWSRGYIDGHYGEGYAGGVVEYTRPRVLVVKGRLSDDDMVILSNMIRVACGNNVESNKNQGSLIIIANSYSDSIRTFLSNNRHIEQMADDPRWRGRTNFKITAVDIDSVMQESIDKVHSIALLSGCTIYDKNVKGLIADATVNPDKYLGFLDSAKITKDSTYLYTDDSLLSESAITTKNDEVNRIYKRLAELKSHGDFGSAENKEQYYLQLKLANLTKASAVYHVGGFTQEERNSRSRLIEDAIYSTQSAMRLGCIYGGNLAIPIIIRDNKKQLVAELETEFKYLTKLNFNFDLFIDIIKEAFKESYKLVLSNSSLSNPNEVVEICLNKNKFYNLKTHEYEKLNETVVINSIGTDIEIMKSCFSIIGMLVTSNQILTSVLITDMQ